MKPDIGAGDDGTTSLVGRRISKTSLVVDIIGDVDELNSLLGIAQANCSSELVKENIKQVQKKLFSVGAFLAGDAKHAVTQEDINELEEKLVEAEQKLSELKHFILPGGCSGGAFLHHARSYCRKCERKTHLLTTEKGLIAVYLNRLGDLLFALARLENKHNDASEEQWP